MWHLDFKGPGSCCMLQWRVIHQEHEHLKQLKRRHAELVKASKQVRASVLHGCPMSNLRISHELLENGDDPENPAECNNYSSLM